MPEAATKTAHTRTDGRARDRSNDPEVVTVHQAAGLDLPGLGHVPYRSAAFYGGLAAAGTVGVLEWPVAAAVGAAYALARRGR